MVKIRHIVAFIVAVFVLAPSVFAQRELLVNAPVLRQRAALLKSKTVALDTLNLPFFDDFSVPTNGAPNLRKWQNSYVYANNSYGINSPTMGVATFDICDEQGRIYAHASSLPFAADTLTSMPFSLQPADENVYLSFFYQPQGNGDMPERRDSLTLQFFSPADSAWINVWSATADTVGSSVPNVLNEIFYLPSVSKKQVGNDSVSRRFFTVMLPVSEARFLQPGFCFRFVNYATRSRSEVKGRESSCDMWNIDVVYLNKNRTAEDTEMVDVAIQTPIQRLLKEYAVMPWQHLKNNTTAQREQLVNAQGSGVSISPKVSNLNVASATAFTYVYSATSVADGALLYAIKDENAITGNITPATTIAINRALPLSSILNAAQPDEDSVAIDVRLRLLPLTYTVDEQLKNDFFANDTCTYRQYFYPYYAYDDGSAENGYGLFGEGSNMAKAAVKFKCYWRDTLSGVYLYFNSTLDSGNMQPFRLTVWSDKGGEPDQELYSEANLYPSFDSLNSYTYYPLTRPVVLGEDATFYVGWTQQNNEYLNVGFDVNSRVAGKHYVNIKGTWELSREDGSGVLMIRPSFAKQKFDMPTAVNTSAANAYSITVYPNPVRDELYLNLPDALREKTLRVEIFDLLGKRLALREANSLGSVNVSALPLGSYIARFSESGKVVGYAKFFKR
ncbi:MAG: T9SS type A sorting domain-containing protein [Prevotellaceae bacterium]|jgi:hypothetical protein|nr:T9SS type A sorting domain-containing protein [Prevotellaceae bacterium]